MMLLAKTLEDMRRGLTIVGSSRVGGLDESRGGKADDIAGFPREQSEAPTSSISFAIDAAALNGRSQE